MTFFLTLGSKKRKIIEKIIFYHHILSFQSLHVSEKSKNIEHLKCLLHVTNDLLPWHAVLELPGNCCAPTCQFKIRSVAPFE